MRQLNFLVYISGSREDSFSTVYLLLIAKIASFYSIPTYKTLDYLTNTIVYSHGLLVAIVSGTIKVDRQTAKEKVHNACCAFLLQAGGDIKKAQRENNFLKNEGYLNKFGISKAIST